jgi:hypothetical protein
MQIVKEKKEGAIRFVIIEKNVSIPELLVIINERVGL